MKVRRATIEDYPALQSIDRVAFGDHAMDVFSLRQWMELFPSLARIATLDSRVVGFTLGGVSCPDGVGLIASVAVLPEFRGRGLGRDLTEDLLDRLHEIGVDRVRLTVAPDNETALAMYRSLGFRATGSVLGYFGPGRDRVLMERAPAEPDGPSPGDASR